MAFIPHTEKDVAEMLAAIGVQSIDQLFDEIPQNLRMKSLAGMPVALNEMEIGRLMSARAKQDGRPLYFIGAGAYEHHIPAAVWAIATRGEFYSAYTPYQAEASQGTLQLLYEYQTMIASLTGMQVSNASLYDGASAVAEACLMAVRANRKSKSLRILVPTTVNPHYRRVAHASASNQSLRFEELAYSPDEGRTLVDSLAKYEGQDITAIVIQQPNFFGVLEDVDALTDWAHARGILVIAVVNPMSLAMLKPPGEWGTAAPQSRCRHRSRRWAAARCAALLGWSVLRLHHHAHGTRAPDAGANHRSHSGSERQGRLHAHPASPRAAHPPQQGDVEHLHQPRVAGDGRDDLHVPDGSARLAACSRSLARQTRELVTALTRVKGVRTAFTKLCFHECVVLLDRPVAPVLKALETQEVLGGFDLPNTTRSWASAARLRD